MGNSFIASSKRSCVDLPPNGHIVDASRIEFFVPLNDMGALERETGGGFGDSRKWLSW